MADIVKIRNITFAVFCVGFLLFLIGFSAPYWVEHTDDSGRYTYEGLWKTCWDIGLGANCVNRDPGNTASKVIATQANMCIALILLIATLAGYILWFMKRSSDLRRDGMTDVGRITLYSSASAGCFNFLAILIYGFYWVNYGEFLHYAYALSVVSALTFTICGFTAVCYADFGSKSPGSRAASGAVGYPAVGDLGVQTAYPQNNGSAPVYFMPQNSGQQINMVYQAGAAGFDPGTTAAAYGQAPAYSANPPPTYQDEWQNKGNQGEGATGQTPNTMATDQQYSHAMATNQQPTYAMLTNQQAAMTTNQQPAMATNQLPANVMATNQQPAMATNQLPVNTMVTTPSVQVDTSQTAAGNTNLGAEYEDLNDLGTPNPLFNPINDLASGQ